MGNFLSKCGRRRGSAVTLLSACVGGVIAFGAIVYFSRQTQNSRQTAVRMQDLTNGHVVATELLEYFRGMKKDRLISYLQSNPVTGSSSGPHLYSICAHINLLDRTNNIVLNRDPLADTAGVDLGPRTSKLELNRFYKLEVINMTTLQIDRSRCGSTTASPFALSADESFLVTVGVSWKEFESSDIARVVLSTVLM